jgi:hypothetical protein
LYRSQLLSRLTGESPLGSPLELQDSLPFDLRTDGCSNFIELYQPCAEAREELIEITNKYRKKTNQPVIDKVEIEDWATVDMIVQTSCDDLDKLVERDKNVSGVTGKLRNAFRSLCRHADAGERVISLIPRDALGVSSSVCSAFTLIFTAMNKAALYRGEIMRALEELPSVLADSSDLCEALVFGDDKELHSRRAALIAAILRALAHIMTWFVKNPFGKLDHNQPGVLIAYHLRQRRVLS